MSKFSTISASSALICLACAPALADGVTKTWVSSTTGNDSGTCQFTTPCKTFAYAITQTLEGGEIDVKDGGSYGPVMITQAVSIVAAGVLAEVSVPSGGVGVTVQAGYKDKVVLQGLVIDGHGVGVDGVDFYGGSSVTVIDCHIRNLTEYGISVQFGNSYNCNISKTEVENAVMMGIEVGGAPQCSVDQVDLHDNGIGLFGGNSNVFVTNSNIHNNSVGIESASAANVVISQDVIVLNSKYGIDLEQGKVFTYEDNNIYGRPSTDQCHGHWLNGDGASAFENLDAQHTGVGYATHHAATIFWALLFERLLAARRSPTRAARVKAAAATAAVAVIIDYGATPKRFTPGWEFVLSKRAMSAAYAAMALGWRSPEHDGGLAETRHRNSSRASSS